MPAAGAATYPVAGGNGFTGGTEDWTGASASCSQAPLCSAENTYTPTQGNPSGSLESRTDIFVNGGQVFTGALSWRSPSFIASTIGSGTFEYDRQLSAPGLAAVEPAVTVEEVLVNETTGKTKSLGVEQVALADSVFRGRTVPVKANTLTIGNRYHLELRSRMTTNSAQVGPTGSITVRFDNVALTLSDRGPSGASGSAGVRFVKDPLSDRQMRRLIKRTNWSADRGHLAGGSIVAKKDCTIVGTPGKDRIVGSTGNDVICGLGGNDTINGQSGIDLVDTGAGADRTTAAGGGDVVAGLGGRDNLLGNGSGDRLGGGAGRDRISGGAAKDRINGGSGTDRVVGGLRDRIAKVERRG